MRLVARGCAVAVLVASLAGTPMFAAPSRAVGVVLQAEHARLSGGDAANGASVFDGDRLSTEERGMSRMRVGAAQLYLMGNSGVLMRQISNGAGAVLEQGTVIWSVAAGEPFELRALDAMIRAKAGQPAVGQVTLLSPNAFVITSNRGELEVTIDEVTRVVPEGNSYRVELDPEPQGTPRTRKAGRAKFIWIPLFAIAGVTTYFIVHAIMSPDK
jgi:hypothetical protein